MSEQTDKWLERDITLAIAQQIYIQGLFELRCIERADMEKILDSANTLIKVAFTLGQLYAKAKIAYCQETENSF